MAEENTAFSQIKEITYENTYITDPSGYGPNARLQRHKIQAILKELLVAKLSKLEYDPIKASMTAKQLADDIREKAKQLGYDRYKLVVQVALGQKTGYMDHITSDLPSCEDLLLRTLQDC